VKSIHPPLIEVGVFFQDYQIKGVVEFIDCKFMVVKDSFIATSFDEIDNFRLLEVMGNKYEFC
jgi:hypothetical protein